MTARERIDMLLDKGTFNEIDKFVVHHIAVKQHNIFRKKQYSISTHRITRDSPSHHSFIFGRYAGSNLHQFFVPPVYDLLQPDGFFRIEEANISAINKQIKELEGSQQLKDMRSRLAACQAQASQTLADAKQQMKEAKLAREQQRAEGISEEEQKNLIRESQFQKAEYKRLEKKAEGRKHSSRRKS